MALVNGDDRQHQACRDFLELAPGPLVVPLLVIGEVTYLVGSRIGSEAEARFLVDLALGTYSIDPVPASDWLRIAELVRQYRDLRLGTVDASVVAAAERLGIVEVATLDRRHFSIVRPRHAERFALLP